MDVRERLPPRSAPPEPHGWFELLCCATVLLVFAGALVALALAAR